MADVPVTATDDSLPSTAVEAAVVKDDYPAFEAAERAALNGKPLDAPDPDAAPAAPAAAPVLSKRQQDLNDRIKKATDAVALAKDAEIADLRAKLTVVPRPERPAPPAAAAAPVAKPATFPSFADYAAAHPDASLETWMDARDEWRDQQREQAKAARTEQQTVDQADQDRMARASEQVTARAADPEFVKNLNPRLLQIETFADAGRNGRETGPSNVIAEEMFKSEALVPLLEHFSKNPADLARLEALPAHLAKLPPRQRIAEHTRWIVREMGKIEATLTPATAAAEATTKPKTISSAPRPPADLGARTTESADPIASAVKANDYSAFEAAERRRLLADRTR